MDEGPPEEPTQEPAPAALPPPAEPRVFRAGRAFLALLVYFAGQFVFAFAVGMLFGLLHHLSVPGFRRESLFPAVMLGASIGSAVAVVWITRRWSRVFVQDLSPSGLGLVRPGIGTLLSSALVGAILAGAYIAILLSVNSAAPTGPPGPVAKLAAQSGWGRLFWAFIALAIAPPTEELLFRGLLLKGLTASWGIWAASITTTVIFVSLHFPETQFHPLATLALTALAVAALVARLRTGSLYSSMAVHFAYNLVFVGTWYGLFGI